MEELQTKAKFPKLLKPHFQLTNDGGLELHSFLTLDLKSEEGASEDYYLIENDIVLGQPNFLGSVHWALGQSIWFWIGSHARYDRLIS
jgi:hypothetical protein